MLSSRSATYLAPLNVDNRTSTVPVTAGARWARGGRTIYSSRASLFVAGQGQLLAFGPHLGDDIVQYLGKRPLGTPARK